MNNRVTIIMYHYVRNLEHSRYPEIKGLSFLGFKKQIKHIKKHFEIIPMELLIYSLENNIELPERAAILTFDDGYSDHFDYVFPILDENKVQGSFYITAKPILEKTVLDVNKIHYILASELNTGRIISQIKSSLEKKENGEGDQIFDRIWKKHAIKSRFDKRDVTFIKRVLQFGLEVSLRKKIIDELFQNILKTDEKTLNNELYMSVEQIKCLQRNGMHVGSHSYDHNWLGSLTYNEQMLDIKNSIKFLKLVDVNLQNWTMCYPYGDFNDSTVDILKTNNCKLALGTRVGIANIKKESRFDLPRLDTNDIIINPNSNV